MAALLAQQLVGAGEHVVDVPPKLSARVRVRRQRPDRQQAHPDDAGVATVALRNATLNSVGAEGEHRVVLRLLADRYHQLSAQRTRSVCRLHAVLCLLIEGGTGRSLSTTRAVKLLAGVAIGDPIIAERVATCRQYVAELEALDQALVDIRARTVSAVDASKTTVIDVYGVGPIGAAIILGHSGDIRRFPTAGHYARHNGTAPIEASSGPRPATGSTPEATGSSTTPSTPPPSPRSPTITPAASTTTQDRRGEDEEGGTPHAEAAHQRRHLPAASRRHLRPRQTAAPGPAPDSPSAATAGPEDNAGTTRESSVAGLAPHDSRLFGQVAPGPNATLEARRSTNPRARLRPRPTTGETRP